jgi:zinc protease
MRRLVAPIVLLLAAPPARADLSLDAPLPVDPAVTFGRLPNGMSTWIRRHQTPPGKVAMWLAVNTGSLNESERERGLAHFVEHMAFNGTRNFPPGQVVKYFQSIGLRFGHDQNAATGFDWTTYQLALPDTRPATIGKGLTCFADFVFRQTLAPAEIDRERAVVLAEGRARKGYQQRLIERILPVMFPGSLLAERLPIGKEDTLRTVGRDAFTSYISRFYRPDQATLLVAGDIDPAAMQKMIAAAFAGWPTPASRPANAGAGLRPRRGDRAAVVTDPEMPLALVELSTFRPLHPTLTVKDSRDRLIEGIGVWLVDRRMDELVKKGKAPFQSAEGSVGSIFNAATAIQLDANGDGTAWREMLTTLITEARRAREHGFSTEELADARRATLADAEQQAATESTKDAGGFLSSMQGSLTARERPTSSAQLLALDRALLPGITIAEVNAAYRANFAPGDRMILLAGPQGKGFVPPTEQELLAAAARAEATPVAGPTQEPRVTRLMATDPTPGTIVEQSEDPALHILSVTFANGARVHLRSMSYRKNEVEASVLLAGGELRETAATRGLTDVAGLAFSSPATAGLSSTQIRNYLTGTKIGIGGGAEGDDLAVRLSSAPDQLEDAMRLAHLLLREARVEAPSLERWKKETRQNIARNQSSVEARAGERLTSLLTGDDVRGRPYSPADLERLAVPAAQSWLDQHLRGAPIEAAIVGDAPRERLLELARKYLGSLPARPRADAALDGLRRTAGRPGPLTSTVDVETVTPRALVAVGWRGPDFPQLHDQRLLTMAALILRTRLEVELREKRGLTYSVSCGASSGDVLFGTGTFAASLTVDPARARTAAALTRRLFGEFARRGPTPAEVATVHNQIRNDMEVQVQRPDYWRSRLEDLDLRHRTVEDYDKLLPEALATTGEEIRAMVARYLREDRRFEIIARPAKPAAPTAISERTPAPAPR